MEFNDVLKLITVVIVIVNGWVLYSNRNTREDLKELREQLSEAKDTANAAKAEADRAKEDITAIKADIHSLTGTMIESINKLDSRLHNFIVAQVKGVPTK